MLKKINVVAAVIKKDDKYLATQRGYGEFINMWEFPGGKIEPNETREEALVREIKEDCYLCKLNDDITLLEHNAYAWLKREKLNTVKWLPADIEVIDYIINNN